MDDHKIFERPEYQRYWVVRANGSIYYKHFLDYSLIACGHLDPLRLPDSYGYPFSPDISDLKKKFEKYHTSLKRSRPQISSRFNQIKSFVYDMKPGDWVMTVGGYEIRLGRIVGRPYINKKPLDVIYDKERDYKVTMESNLRRKVVWGPKFSRSRVPYAIGQSLKANQAIFNIDDHWEALYHVIYPFFRSGPKLYFSANIEQKEDIDNFSLSHFFSLLSEFEIISRSFDEFDDFLKLSFEDIVSKFMASQQFSLTSKAHFMSDGSIWGALTIDPKFGKKVLIFYIAFSAFFGSDILGWDGLVDLETRHKIRDIVLERVEAHHGQMIKEQLKLIRPDYDTFALEDESNDLENDIPQKT